MRRLGRRRRMRDLSRGHQVLVVVGAALEHVLTGVAARDLATRDETQVRGPKALWAAVLGVQPLGPLACLLLGRRGRAAAR